ncbi:beta strand repeat-containing protein, partial [Aequorivita antarctica]
MKKITLLIVLLFVTYIGNSQTTLTAGDIAFVGSNSDGATNADDTVAFVLLKDIDAATTIIFTDMGWNDGTGFFAISGDGEFTWTSGSARSAGDVVTIDMSPLFPAAYSSIGDQLFAIQGSTAAPIFIAGLQFNDAPGDDANWDGAATTNSTSALPNALVTGTTAVRLVPESDNWQFSCALAGGPVTGTAAQIRAIVNNRVNWVDSQSVAYNPALEAGCTFTISTGGDTTPPVISCAPTPAPIIAGTNGMAAIPDLVSGTTATDNVSIPANITITQSPTAGTMAGVGVNSVVLTATDEAGNTASCTIPVTINEPPSTTLASGDIAFVGFNLDDTDSFAFIILKDIIAGTNIKFTDCGVTNPNTISCAGAGGDASATWYASSAMSAGDIVTLPGSFMAGSVLSSIGDQLFAYQGTAASPNFITGVHSNVDPGVTNDTDWDGGNTSSTTTSLPDQLTNGVNAIRLYVAGAPETEVDNWQFDCSSVPGGVPITGTAAQISAIINDIQYWVNNDATEFVPTANSGCGYSVILTLFAAPADLCIDAGVQTSLGGGTPTGGVYSGPGVTDDGNGLTYSFDPATAGVGIHTLTYTENGNSATDDVEVFALDDASFNYSAASYCANDADPTPTITGLGGGTFTSGAGLSINASTGAIDVSASTPGTYTITYTTAGTCPNAASVSVTINALDDASFNYNAANYCVNETDPTPTITGLGGGTFTSGAGLSINASTGAIDVSASTPGTYTVTYTTAGTCPNAASVSVTINALDDASFNYGAASYCVSAADPTPTITGLGGGTFTSAPAGLSINAATGLIDVSASTPGIYTVTYTTAGTCTNSSGVSVTINALDDASFNYGAASYCVSAADPTPTITGVAGGTFTSGAGLSINAATGTIDVSASTPGAYTVTYTTSGTCPNISSVSVTINALDDASFNYSAAAYCADEADPTPTITGVAGGTFTSGAGLSINAATGTIDVSASTPGTYTITYTTAGVCTNSSSVSVTINALDDASFNYSAAAYCVDAADPTPTITGLGGGTFTSGAGLSINAGTGTIDVSASTPGAYTVTYTTSGTCPNSSSVSVTINALPTVTFSAPMSPVCPSAVLTGQGGGTPMGGVYSGPGVTDDGNGMTYTFDAGAAGNGTHILTYTFSDANGCTNSASDSVTVEDTEPPVANCAAPFTIQLDV